MELRIKTKNNEEFINLTEDIKKFVKKSKVNNGICYVYARHTTASIVIAESDDPAIGEDLFEAMSKLIKKGIWKHDRNGRCDRGNGDAHIKATFLGNEKFIPIKNNKLDLGTWQEIFLVEFDGPREREIAVSIENIKNK